MEGVWKHRNREKMEGNIKLSVSSMEGMTQLKGGNWKRGRFCVLNVEQEKRSRSRTGE